jgi:catechol-2,3-dioxygenase
LPVTRLNHAVLYVRDVERTAAFYTEVLGFEPIGGDAALKGAAFLRAPGSTNDHDIGLFEVGSDAAGSQAGRGSVGLYHLAWEVDTLDELERFAGVLAGAGSLVGASDHSTTKSLYAKDPDGLEFEVVWIVPAALLDDEARSSKGILPLDIAKEKARYGASSRGGVGISIPAPV